MLSEQAAACRFKLLQHCWTCLPGPRTVEQTGAQLSAGCCFLTGLSMALQPVELNQAVAWVPSREKPTWSAVLGPACRALVSERAGRSRCTSSQQAAAHLLWLLKHGRPLPASHHILQELLEGLSGLVEAPAGTVAGVRLDERSPMLLPASVVLLQCSCRAQACGQVGVHGRIQDCRLCSASRPCQTSVQSDEAC